MHPPFDPLRLSSVPWAPVAAPTGLGWLLLAILPGDAVLLAPPGTHLPGGHDADAGRWRICAWAWAEEADLAYEHLAVLCPAQVAVDTAFVLRALPEDQHGWVRGVMQGQVRDAYAFSSVPSGDFLDDDRALACAWRLRDLVDELTEAFPDEDWYAVDEPDETTVDALIAQRPALTAAAPRRAPAFARYRAPLLVRLSARVLALMLTLPVLNTLRGRAAAPRLRRAVRWLPGARKVHRELDRTAPPPESSPCGEQPTGELMNVG